MRPLFLLIDPTCKLEVVFAIEKRNEAFREKQEMLDSLGFKGAQLGFSPITASNDVNFNTVFFDNPKQADPEYWKSLNHGGYVPYRKTNKQKELYKKVSEIFGTVSFLETDKINLIEKLLKWNPKKRMETTRPGVLTINDLIFGWNILKQGKSLKLQNVNVIFKGYDGYVPPKGRAKELTVSECKKLMDK